MTTASAITMARGVARVGVAAVTVMVAAATAAATAAAVMSMTIVAAAAASGSSSVVAISVAIIAPIRNHAALEQTLFSADEAQPLQRSLCNPEAPFRPP